MQKQAFVLQTNGEEATVAVLRQEACASCHSACAGCSRTIRAKAKNTVGAQVGDTVCLESDGRRLTAMAFLVFVLPILLAFLGYALGRSLSLNPSAAAWLAAGIGSAALFLAAALCNRALKARCDLQIVMILSPQDAENGVRND